MNKQKYYTSNEEEVVYLFRHGFQYIAHNSYGYEYSDSFDLAWCVMQYYDIKHHNPTLILVQEKI